MTDETKTGPAAPAEPQPDPKLALETAEAVVTACVKAEAEAFEVYARLCGETREAIARRDALAST